MVTCIQVAAAGVGWRTGQACVQNDGVASVVSALPIAAIGGVQIQGVQVGAIAVGLDEAVLRCHRAAGRHTGLGGLALAIDIALAADGDQQFVSRYHLQIAGRHAHVVIAVHGGGCAAQTVHAAQAAHAGELDACVAAVACAGCSPGQSVGCGFAVDQAGVAEALVKGQVGVLRDKHLGVVHFDVECGRVDLAHSAAGAGGQAVVVQVGVDLRSVIAEQQTGAHGAITGIGRDILVGIHGSALGDVGPLSADPATGGKVRAVHSGRVQAVIGLFHGALQGRCDGGFVDGAVAVAHQRQAVVAAVVAVLERGAVEGDGFIARTRVLVGENQSGCRDRVTADELRRQGCQVSGTGAVVQVAVIGLAHGASAEAQGLGRDVGRGAGLRCQRVVAQVRATQGVGQSDHLGSARVLVAEGACAGHGQVIACNATIPNHRAGGHRGMGVAVIGFGRCADAAQTQGLGVDVGLVGQ